MSERLGLFPLGTTLLPGQLLPLHVFEQRYRDLVRDVVQGAFDPRSGVAPRGPRFGVVAIRRGSEVGADAAPELYGVGCVAEVLEVQQHRNGTSDLVAVGRERFELVAIDASAGTSYLTGWVRWLDEPPGSATPELASQVRRLFEQYRGIVTVRGARSEDAAQGAGEAASEAPGDDVHRGADAGADETIGRPGEGAAAPRPHTGASGEKSTKPALPSDPTVLSWAVAGAMVLHAGERQRLLEDPDASARLRRLRRFLRRELTLLPVVPSLPTADFARLSADPR